MSGRPPKPLLLLDVDGVICPLGRPDAPGVVEVEIDFAVRPLSLTARDLLPKLGEHFQLVWATSWERQANDVLSPLLGIPPLPWIEFDSDFEPGEHHKVRDIAAHVKDRPFAWVDDELDEGCQRWAESLSQETLLLGVDPRVGLADGEVQDLLAFARRLR